MFKPIEATNLYDAMAFGCELSASHAATSLTDNVLRIVNAFSNNSVICFGQSPSLTANIETTYAWNTATTGSVVAILPSVTITYTVNGTGLDVCNNGTTVT